ncbi:MAG: serine protease [Cyclobacteriaceae bacterium]|nr:serine protease [Cyclobacteriaceae bacterium]
MVTSNGKANTCSGFLWKQGNWVVTSLHAMRPGGNVLVQYPDNNWKNASIKKINIKADLVLLELTPGQTVPAGVLPLQGYSPKQLVFDEPIYAVGYNSGSEGSPTRSMKKGDLKPKETLEFLVPPADLAKVKQGGIPHYQLDIIYIDGSLLPGYSGSPVYDRSGNLVGIGDGGLEGGASNVSWVIPAKYLLDLENSTATTLPPGFEKTVLHFSAEAEVSYTSETPEAIDELFADEYKSYNGGDFMFYYTKTRTLDELFNSSYDPGNISKIVNEFQANRLFLDYNLMSYDIYEDANNGIVVAIPEDQPFDYDDNYGIFYTDLTNFPQGYYYSLRFEGIKGDFGSQTIEQTAMDLVANLTESLGGASNGFTPEPDYTYSTTIDDSRSIAHIGLVGNSAFINTDNISVVKILYITLLQDADGAFYSIAELVIPVEVYTNAITYGIDCINNYDQSPEYCDFFESYSKIMCGAHLTTFANKQGN